MLTMPVLPTPTHYWPETYIVIEITQDLFLVSKQAVCITDLDVRIAFSQLFYVTHLSQHVWCTKQGERALRLNRKLA